MLDEQSKDQQLETVDIEVRCPVETRVLCIIRLFATCLAREAGFSEEQVSQIEMSVDEACANVMRHAYKHLGVSSDLPEERRAKDVRTRMDCVLKLRAFVSDDYLRISIIDHGIGMHRMPPGVRSVQEYQERGGSGGLGIYIIQNFMDEVEYDFPQESGTVLTMTKYLRPQQAQIAE